MDGKFTMRCPGCKATIRAPYALLGQSRSCPGCGRAFVVRPQRPADSDPVLVSTDWSLAATARK